MNPPPGTAETCDFCMASPVIKSFDAAPFVALFADELVLFAQTKWATCVDCAALITANHWLDLEDRAVDASVRWLQAEGLAMGYSHRQLVRQELRNMHQCIREAMRRTA